MDIAMKINRERIKGNSYFELSTNLKKRGFTYEKEGGVRFFKIPGEECPPPTSNLGRHE